MVDILTEIKIVRPQDVVAEYASNPDNAPEWYMNMKPAMRWANRKDLARLKQILENNALSRKYLSE